MSHNEPQLPVSSSRWINANSDNWIHPNNYLVHVLCVAKIDPRTVERFSAGNDKQTTLFHPYDETSSSNEQNFTVPKGRGIMTNTNKHNKQLI